MASGAGYPGVRRAGNGGPTSPHAVASSEIGIDVGGTFGRRGGPSGWVILDEPELHLGGELRPRSRVLVPDLAGWRRERMPAVPDVPGFQLVPDWVCEVLSPSTARLDRTVKLPVHAEAGVRWLWFVDALARTLEVLELSGGRYSIDQTFAGEGEVRARPFDAVGLTLGNWWLSEGEGGG